MRIDGSLLSHFLNELKLLMPAYNSINGFQGVVSKLIYPPNFKLRSI